MTIYFYDQLSYWLENYGRSGATDQRAVQDYIDSETDERIRIFQSQLYAVSKGKYDEFWMDYTLGEDRKVRHMTFERWAELMLLWMASYQKKA